MLFAIQSISQTGYTLVPDSLTCITPEQDALNIEQYYLVKEMGSSLVLQDQIIRTLNAENGFLRNESAEKDKEINLRLLQNKHCQDDKLYVEKQLNKALRGKRLFKTGFVIVGAVAVTELVYIGVLRVVK